MVVISCWYLEDILSYPSFNAPKIHIQTQKNGKISIISHPRMPHNHPQLLPPEPIFNPGKTLVTTVLLIWHYTSWWHPSKNILCSSTKKNQKTSRTSPTNMATSHQKCLRKPNIILDYNPKATLLKITEMAHDISLLPFVEWCTGSVHKVGGLV